MTAKDQKSRDAALFREHARQCAKMFRVAMKSLNRATTKAARDDAQASLSLAGLWLWMLCGCNPDNLGKALQAVTLAADGKLSEKSFDVLIRKAVAHAGKKAQAQAGIHRGLDIGIKATPKQIDDALTVLCGRERRPTKDGAVRRAKILGLR